MRIRTRYVIPASAVEQLAAQAAESGGCVDVGRIAAERRTAREGEPGTRGCAVVSHDQAPDYAAIAVRLDRLRHVPDDVLTTVVVRGGLCFRLLWPPDEPDWDDAAPSDRALAARLCAGCPVTSPCLELDLRTAEAQTTGVWGALPENDRRTLHPIWQQHRQQPTHREQEGGQTP